jgi:uncharacterized protein
MKKHIAIILLFVAACAMAVTGVREISAAEELCSDAWFRFVEQNVPTGDGQGHGPDIGSEEWKSVVEFKLGIRGKPEVPTRTSGAWCRYIDKIVQSEFTPSAGTENLGQTGKALGPSFPCEKVEPGSIEEMICKDEELSALDRKLARVYAAALQKATNEHPPVLRAMQRGWIKGRNECWKSDKIRDCVQDAYISRIAELHAQYRLVSFIGPVRFVCDGNPANEVIVTFFQTDPPTLIAEHGDEVSLMYREISASGTKYQGRNESFWEHQGEARITWGYGAQPMTCIKKAF